MLRVSDEQQPRVTVEGRLEHRPLGLIGVLKLIDEGGVVALTDPPRERAVRATRCGDAIGDAQDLLDAMRDINDGDPLLFQAGDDVKKPLGLALGQR